MGNSNISRIFNTSNPFTNPEHHSRKIGSHVTYNNKEESWWSSFLKLFSCTRKQNSKQKTPPRFGAYDGGARKTRKNKK